MHPGQNVPEIARQNMNSPPPGDATDEEIYCPLCNYNLTGVHSGRCPECGGIFHREALFAAQKANQITLMPWDDPEPMSVFRRFGRTLSVCLFNARRFAFAFSVQPQRTRAASFQILVMLAVTALSCLPVLVGAAVSRSGKNLVLTVDLDDVLGIGLLTVAVILIVLVFLTLLSAAILWLLCPHYDGSLKFGPWYAITAYATAHWLFIGAALPFYFLFLKWSGGEPTLAMVTMFVVILLGCGSLQVATIGGIVKLRTAPSANRRIAVLLIALMHGATALFAPVLGGLVAGVLWTLL